MSSATYLAWSALFAGLLVAIGQVLARAIPTVAPEKRKVWLERRLAARLERGTDRYFEEKRSIESALAETSVVAPSHAKWWWDDITFVLSIVFLSLMITRWIGEPLLHSKPPAWSELVTTLWIPFWGLSMFVNPSVADPSGRLAYRILGGILAALSLAAAVSEFHSFLTKA